LAVALEVHPLGVLFEAGIADALNYLRYPGFHHTRIRTTHVLERLFKEVKRRMRVVRVSPNETSVLVLIYRTL
jgi:putative transposase